MADDNCQLQSALSYCSSTGSISSDQMSVLRTRGHKHNLEVLKHSAQWVDILMTSDDPMATNQLHSFGLTDCSLLTSLSDLLTTELQQNWRTLQHHNLHPSWQVESVHPSAGLSESIEEREKDQRIPSARLLKRDTEKCKDSKACDDESFAHYVSLFLVYMYAQTYIILCVCVCECM